MNLQSTKINNRQKYYNHNTSIHESYESKKVTLGKIDKKNLTMKNKVTSSNTIDLQSHRDINTSLDFERQ